MRRRPVLGADAAHPEAATAARRERRKRNRFIPFLILAAFALFIASQEVPMVRDTIQRIVAPDRWAAARTCRREALAKAGNPDFARIVDPGELHPTRNGFFVEGIRVGEMAEQGGEAQFVVDCYTDAAGALVRATRLAVPVE
ncbi:MAG TPA: hypothetical protein ENK05_03805 [Gammaproteobacteria bacterium]|nr:hypothetical protein [Gammaproteobacteria bacterium]